MGRWAQRNRRGGGAPGSNPAPAPTVVDVVINSATEADVVFSAAVTFQAGGPSTNFTVNGNDTAGIAQVAADTIRVGNGSASWSSGQSWVMLFPPPWMVETPATPASGTVS